MTAWCGRIALLAVSVVALAWPAPAAADRFERSLRWSGHTWTVRSTTKPGNPGNNRWGDSRNNVRVRGDKTLRLNIVRRNSVEVVGPRTGYGKYRWVVRSDLSVVDPFRVVAFFVRGTRGERDIEFSRWAEPLSTTPGSWVQWRDHARVSYGIFPFLSAAPYTIVIDWKIGATRYAMQDASGAMLLDITVPSSGGGRHIAPRISYWRYPGHGTFLSPFTSATVHPPVIIESFKYFKLKT